MTTAFQARLDAVDWARYSTAYGVAADVPEQLQRLKYGDEDAQLDAAHELWCGLCHQRTYVSSAALPALPFIIDALDSANEGLAIELLEILLGFAQCTNQRRQPELPAWAAELRTGVAGQRERLKLLQTHTNAEVADLAGATLAELDQE